MGVEYHHCESCDDSHYEEYVDRCTKCSSRLCTNCLVNRDIFRNGNLSRYASHYGEKFDSSNTERVKELVADYYVEVDEEGNYDLEDGDIIPETAIDPNYCPFCQGNRINNDEVLSYLLTKYNLDINNVWDEMKNR